MRFLSQLAAVTANSLRTLPGRWPSALVTIIGTATAVGVLMSMLAIVAGAHRMAAASLNPARVIVMPAGAANETTGALSKPDVAVMAEASGVRRDPAGKPMIQPIAIVLVDLRKQKGGADVAVQLRGTGPQEWRMDPDLRITRGRAYRPGLNELIVGEGAQREYAGLKVGGHLSLRGTEWTVVGSFTDGGGVNESGLMADADTVLAAFDRDSYQNAQVQLTSAAALPRFRAALAASPQLSLTVQPYGQYLAEQVRPFTAVLNFVAYFVGAVIGLGAIFGAISTMYAAVDSRKREIATLRAIGFGGGVVVFSVLIEAVALSIPGAGLGALGAAVLFGRRAASSDRFLFEMTITPQIVTLGVVWAIAIAFLAGLPPSIRAARMPVAASLRAR
jgi:putative ABC transport system permease protein